MEEKIKLKKIVPASLFARTFGAIIDLAITLFVGIGLAIGVVYLCRTLPSIKAHQDNYTQVMTDSGLINYDKKTKTVTFVEKDSYKGYEEVVYTFYSEFMSSKTEYKYTHDIYWYNVHVYGLDDVQNLYSSDDLKENVLAISKAYGKQLFTYKLDNENNPVVNEFALPKVLENDISKEISNEDQAKLMKFYFASDQELKTDAMSKEYKYVYFYALSELTSLKEVSSEYNKYNLYGTTIPAMAAIVFTMAIFYFVIPLIFKDGETLGKLIMHTCLVNKLGYHYKRSGKILRFLAPALVVALIIILFGLSLTSVMIVSGIFFISYLFTLFSKEHKAIHDYIAGSLVIDKRESTFFKDYEEEERFEKEAEHYSSLVEDKSDITEDESVLYVNPRYKNKDGEEH